MAKNRGSELHGLILVDKSRGPTSHDVVRVLRRAFSVRPVGHAGTLDPMATGLLVLAVGEATKLLHYLSIEDKEYQVTVALGRETDTLDAEGRVVKESELPGALSRDRVEAVAKSFVGSIIQRPPDVSAIKQNGEPLYKKVRRGERVEAPLREVTVHDVCILDIREGEIDLDIRCSKGFYVRAFARDLAVSLGTVGHVSALRRTKIGTFSVEQAVAYRMVKEATMNVEMRAALQNRMLPLVDACTGMERFVLSEEGCEDAVHGRLISESRIINGSVSNVERPFIALINDKSKVIAIAKVHEGKLRVVRGLTY
jgi:tRNA pseudouridine55 synthase